MRCSDVQALFREYLAQNLAPEEISLFEAHLASCGACQRDFMLYEETTQLALSLGDAAGVRFDAAHRPPPPGRERGEPFYKRAADPLKLLALVACGTLLLLAAHFTPLPEDRSGALGRSGPLIFVSAFDTDRQSIRRALSLRKGFFLGGWNPEAPYHLVRLPASSLPGLVEDLSVSGEVLYDPAPGAPEGPEALLKLILDSRSE